jgi:hypothetical protein
MHPKHGHIWFRPSELLDLIEGDAHARGSVTRHGAPP